MFEALYKIIVDDEVIAEVETEFSAEAWAADLRFDGYEVDVDYDYRCVNAYSVEEEEEE